MVARRAHNPKVVGSSPASATKQKRHPRGCFFIWFELASDGSQPPAGGTSASLKCGRNLRFPHKRPLPYRKKGTEQEIHSAPITRSKTDMSLWRKDYDSAAPDRSLRNELRLVPGLSGQRACLPWMGHGSERKACQNCSIRKCENKKLFASNVQNTPAAD